MKCHECDALATIDIATSTNFQGTRDHQVRRLCQQPFDELCLAPRPDELHIRIPVPATQAQIAAEESLSVPLFGDHNTTFTLHKRMKDGHSVSLSGGPLHKTILHLVLQTA